MPYFNIVAETNENTVVTEYEPVKVRADQYQSEAALEKEFIRMLCDQGYEYLSIHTEKDLIANLRTKLEELNNYKFTDTEWYQFFHSAVANSNEHIVEKTRKIQDDNVQVLKRDDGSSKNISLIDKQNMSCAENMVCLSLNLTRKNQSLMYSGKQSRKGNRHGEVRSVWISGSLYRKATPGHNS